MAKKGFDAEALKKHQFWIGLGVFALLWILAVVMVKVNATDAKKKAWEEAKGKVSSAQQKGPKTVAYQIPWNKHGERFKKHKDVIWREAWDIQKDMYFWPADMPESAKPKYFDDYFAPLQRDGSPNITEDYNNRSAFAKDWYPSQFPVLTTYNEPAEYLGGFYAIFPMQQWDRSRPPTREEIWLAQEDFWVRREMLFMIREAMDSMAVLKDVTPPQTAAEKLPEGIVGKKVFRNANWELTLLFERDETGRSYLVSDRSTIKNVSPTGRTLVLAHPKTNKGLPFLLTQNFGRSRAPLDIAGEPLPGGSSAPLGKKYRTTPVDVTKPFEVMQILAWENAPIRRIDRLELGLQSHRTVTTQLKMNEVLKNLDPEPEGEAAATDTSSTGSSDSPMGPAPGPGMGGPPGMGGAVAPTNATRVNQINRDRYIQVTPQCRHLPIAMRLIVEQSHIHDVLAAVANSRLRIQITQVLMVHAPDAKRGVSGAEALGPGGGGIAGGYGGGRMGGAGGAAAPPMGGGYTGSDDELGRGSARMGGGSGMYGMGGYGGFPNRPSMPPGLGLGGFGGMGEGGGLAGPTGSATTVAYQDTAHLVELSIYGIATLYNRFPPKPPKAEAAGETPTTTSP